MTKLSENEIRALEMIKGGAILVTDVQEKNHPHWAGGTIPGMTVFKKLEKRGFLFFTEEEPMEDGFTFTEEIYITDEGLNALKENQG